jgi:biotin carboxyl carrier protein
LALLQLNRAQFGNGRLRRYSLIAGTVLTGGMVVRLLHGVVAPVQVDDARLALPSAPLVPATELVVAEEHGRLAQIYVREGAAIAPGQALFSLKRDHQIEQDLVDRGVARDLAEVNDQIRDARRSIDSLAERLVMAQTIVNPQLDQQVSLARQRLDRRLTLWRAGGVSRDFVDDGEERLLRLKRDTAQWREDRQKLVNLQYLMQQQQARLVELQQQQAQLRKADLQRRASVRVHPPLQFNEQSHLDYATYRSPGRGMLLRLLKQPGEAVQPREALAIVQKDLPPPVVEARIPQSEQWLLLPEQEAQVEIPSLRQRYDAQYVGVDQGGDGWQRVRLALKGVPAPEVRRLLTLPGEPVRLRIPREHLLVRWLRTRQLKAWASP